MFETLFRINALVESDELGKCAFKVYEHREPVNEKGFLGIIEEIYQEKVLPVLAIGDELTMLLHVDLSHHEVEKTVQVREDRQFVGDWLAQPTKELFPLFESTYEHFRRQVIPGNVFTITFHVRRV